MKRAQQASRDPGLADLLGYAHLVSDGVLVNKDGAFLVTYALRGLDRHSASAAELDAVSAAFNRLACFLEDGWMLHVDELRVPSVAYPEKGAFPDPVSAWIDAERREQYAAGTHYENFQFLTFVWKFPLPVLKTTRHWFVDGLTNHPESQSLTTCFKQFEDRVGRCVGLLNAHCALEKLSSADLLSYLNTCISGALLPVAVPPQGCFIDVVLGHHSVVGGYTPKVGGQHLVVLSVMGYCHAQTQAGLLEAMGTYPLVYRWSNRFIPLSENTAERVLKRYQRHWHNKVKGLTGIIKEAVFGSPPTSVDHDALQMSQETQEALTANSNRSTRLGYWTSTVILMHKDRSVLYPAVKDLTRYLEQSGFTCHLEDIHALDAWLGTVPGHGSCNLRRLFLHSLNLAHVLPLHSIWSGAKYSAPASLLPAQSPPVLYATTTGKTPFRFHLDVGDVGHQVVLGPTGAGKSTYLGLLMAQFLRYPGAQIFVFDKDYSHHSLTVALGGAHYDLGRADTVALCPLAHLSTDTQKARAQQFIEDLVGLQQVILTPDMRSAIHEAVEALALDTQAASRNLTVFCCQVQHAAVRTALRYYTLEGPMHLLDASSDSLHVGYLHTFEMHGLLAQKPAIYLPVLRTLFDHIESRLEADNGERPTLIVLEEAWLYIAHEVFAKKLHDWLKTLRKKNARVVFATQSLADLYDPSTQTLTGITAAIMESCPTKVYLPHPSMESEIRGLYQKMGLSERHIDTIVQSTPKRHYYVVTPDGHRLIDLCFKATQSLARAFIGLSKEKSQALLHCKDQYGQAWLAVWLRQQGLPAWAAQAKAQRRAAGGLA